MTKNSYQSMVCPVCGEYYFAELQEDDIIDNLQCSHCGWLYDFAQAVDPDLSVGRNAQSVNELRIAYQKKLSENPGYDYSDEHRPAKEAHLCPVCGKHTFKDRDSFDVCPICGWTDDGLMEDEPDRWAGNSNDLCLTDFRKRYLQSKQ